MHVYIKNSDICRCNNNKHYLACATRIRYESPCERWSNDLLNSDDHLTSSSTSFILFWAAYIIIALLVLSSPSLIRYPTNRNKQMLNIAAAATNRLNALYIQQQQRGVAV